MVRCILLDLTFFVFGTSFLFPLLINFLVQTHVRTGCPVHFKKYSSVTNILVTKNITITFAIKKLIYIYLSESFNNKIEDSSA